MVMFIGKTHYKWPCSIAMLNYQRVTCSNPSIVGIFHIFRPKYAQMVNANSPCHPLAFDKRMVRRMALLIRAGTNFISWTYFSPKNRWKLWEISCIKRVMGISRVEFFAPSWCSKLMRNEESSGMWIFLRPIQVDFSKAGILWSPCWDDYAMATRRSLKSVPLSQWNMLENLGVYPSHIQFSLRKPIRLKVNMHYLYHPISILWGHINERYKIYWDIMGSTL